jgi:predicted methyltransferase
MECLIFLILNNALSVYAKGVTTVDINEKIQKAKNYVAKMEGIQEPVSLRNDASNIFADSYEDYMDIWYALMTQKG